MIQMNRKTKQYLHNGLPAVLILVLASLSFSNLLSFEKGKDLFIISLLIIYPVLFIKCGMYTAKNDLFPGAGFFPAIVAFSLVYVLWLNESAIIYFALYTLAYAAGYAFIRFDRYLDNRNKDKEKKSRFYGAKKL